jgi:uncharacterized protein (TIGR03083 family)
VTAPLLSFDDYVAALRREGDLFVTAIETGDLAATVPTCPEWTLRELAHHTGRVHHWAAANVETARPSPLTDDESELAWGSMPADPEVAGWYLGARERLVAALLSAPVDLVAYTFLPNAPAPRLFWARRQAHELAIHRVDAQTVDGAVEPVDDDFAVDGIDELLLGFYSRPRSRVRSATPRTFGVRARSASWILHIGAEGAQAERGDGPADCVVEGSATDLYYALWNRLPLHDFHAGGDGAVIDLWRGSANVRWS